MNAKKTTITAGVLGASAGVVVWALSRPDPDDALIYVKKSFKCPPRGLSRYPVNPFLGGEKRR